MGEGAGPTHPAEIAAVGQRGTRLPARRTPPACRAAPAAAVVRLELSSSVEEGASGRREPDPRLHVWRADCVCLPPKLQSGPSSVEGPPIWTVERRRGVIGSAPKNCAELRWTGSTATHRKRFSRLHAITSGSALQPAASRIWASRTRRTIPIASESGRPPRKRACRASLKYPTGPAFSSARSGGTSHALAEFGSCLSGRGQRHAIGGREVVIC